MNEEQQADLITFQETIDELRFLEKLVIEKRIELGILSKKHYDNKPYQELIKEICEFSKQRI